MDVRFPLFAFEKDDDSMFLIEEASRILYQFESIDIENDEYIFWDSTGAGVCITVTGSAIDQIRRCEQTMSLSDAFEKYSWASGIEVSVEGPPREVWARIQSQLPKRQGLWARLFSR